MDSDLVGLGWNPRFCIFYTSDVLTDVGINGHIVRRKALVVTFVRSLDRYSYIC